MTRVDTAGIDLAMSAGLSVIALAPDWTMAGSHNMLDELSYANATDAEMFGDILTTERLFRVATIDAARALAVDGLLGSLEVGKRADIAVIVGDRADPYRGLLAARPETVRFVLVDGRSLYGDANLVVAGAPGNTCEATTICGADKSCASRRPARATSSTRHTPRSARSWWTRSWTTTPTSRRRRLPISHRSRR